MKTTTLLAALASVLLFAQPSVLAQSTGSLSFGKPKAADPANLVTVEAKGQGESVEAAKKDAVRNAIKKAVGELVDAKTLVENDELVEDKILTLSNAMVEKADYGDAASIGDGLVEVPVTAVVKKGRLNQELKAVGIATGDVKGDSLAASLFSGKERIANAEKFFAERFKDFPQNVMEAVMLTKDDGSPDIEVDTDSGHVFANVGVRVNMENYAEWARQMKELLGAVCVSQEDSSMPFAKKGGCDDKKLFAKLPITPQNGNIPVVIATPKKPELSSWPVSVFYLDGKIWKALSETIEKTFPKNGHIEVALKDADGEIICSAKVLTDGVGSVADQYDFVDRYSMHAIGTSDLGGYGDYPTIPVSGSLWWRNGIEERNGLFIAPASGVSASFYTREAAHVKDLVKSFRMDFGEVSEDDLAEVKGFEVKVEYK